MYVCMVIPGPRPNLGFETMHIRSKFDTKVMIS